MNLNSRTGWVRIHYSVRRRSLNGNANLRGTSNLREKAVGSMDPKFLILMFIESAYHHRSCRPRRARARRRGVSARAGYASLGGTARPVSRAGSAPRQQTPSVSALTSRVRHGALPDAVVVAGRLVRTPSAAVRREVERFDCVSG
eukprot:COSAG02_NODE_316_length_24889_cov_9.418556_9_plen_145_part_00